MRIGRVARVVVWVLVESVGGWRDTWGMDILGMSAAEVDQKTGEDLVELVYQAAYIARVAEALLVRASGAVQEECEGVPVEESLARRYGAKNAQELLRMVTLAPSRVVRAGYVWLLLLAVR